MEWMPLNIPFTSIEFVRIIRQSEQNCKFKGMDQWQAFVTMVMSFWVLYKFRDFVSRGSLCHMESGCYEYLKTSCSLSTVVGRMCV
jgi:hypothetical protein